MEPLFALYLKRFSVGHIASHYNKFLVNLPPEDLNWPLIFAN